MSGKRPAGLRGHRAGTGSRLPAGTPKAAIARLNAETNKALQSRRRDRAIPPAGLRADRRHAGGDERADQGRTSSTGPRSSATPASSRSEQSTMDQNLNTDAVTLTKTLCAHLAGGAVRRSDAGRASARRGAACSTGSAARSPAAGHRTIDDAARGAAGNRRQARRRPCSAASSSSASPTRRSPTARWATSSTTTTRIWAASCCTRARRCWPRCSRSPSAHRSAARELMLAYAVGFEAGVRTRPHRAGPSQGRLASHRHARQHRRRRRRRQAARARRAAADLRDGDRRDAGRRHAAEPRHDVQVVPCRQGRGERRAGGAAGRARLRLRRRRSSKASEGFSRIYSDVAEPEHLTDGLGAAG